MKQLRKTVCYLVHVLNFFGILAGWCGCLVASERGWDTKGMGSSSRFDPGLRFSFFFIETLSITGQKFSKCLKNGSDRLRKGQLLLRASKLPSFGQNTVKHCSNKCRRKFSFFLNSSNSKLLQIK